MVTRVGSRLAQAGGCVFDEDEHRPEPVAIGGAQMGWTTAELFCVLEAH